MPGVADQIRKTHLKNEQKARKQDMEELMRMVNEDRLHEADERQLETLKMSVELNKLLKEKQRVLEEEPRVSGKIGFTTEQFEDLIDHALTTAIKKFATGQLGGVVAQDPSRPQMKHTSLGDIKQADSSVEISGELETESKASDDAASKLEKLKKLKGNG